MAIFFTLCVLLFSLPAHALTVTPQDYGAIVNDGQDDTTAIRAAKNAVCAAGGGILYIPTGTYQINLVMPDRPGLALNLCSNFTMFFEPGGVIQNDASIQNHVGAWRMIGVSETTAPTPYENISIEGCTLDGNFTVPVGGSNAQQQQSHALFFYSAAGTITGVTVRGCALKNLGGDGVQLSINVNNARVEGNDIRDFGRAGIGLGGQGSARAGFWIVNNTAFPHSNAPNGRSVDFEPPTAATQVSRLFIVGNHFNEIQAAGISDVLIEGNWVDGPVLLGGIGAQHQRLVHNRIRNSQPQAAVTVTQEAHHLTIASNDIEQQVTNGEGVRVAPSVYGGSDVQVSSNTITYTGTGTPPNGLYMQQITGGTISDNVVRGFQSCIVASGNTSLAITGNTAACVQSGMQLTGTTALPSTQWEIVGNVLKGNPWALRLIESGGGKFTGVLLKQNLRRGGVIEIQGAPQFVEWD